MKVFKLLIKQFQVEVRRVFFDEGRLDEIENAIQPNDFLVIQFGHNDEKDDEVRHTDPKTTFKQYIKRYIFAAERKQALPILITPVERRIFNKDGVAMDSHGDYPSSIRELSETYQLPLVDLQASSKLLYQTMGPEKSKKLFLWFKKDEYSNFPEGSEDNTHFSEYGAKQIARLIVEDLKKTNSPIKQFLKDR